MITIKIPIPEKVSTNNIYAGSHWTKRKRLADLYHESLIEHRKIRVKEYPVSISYIFTFKSKPLDCDNCGYMGKLLKDGLRKWKVIEDDSPEYVQSCTFISRKGDTDQVEIVIS